MKSVIWLPSSCALYLLLTGCTTKTPDNTGPGTGPFNGRGEYVEAWADDPSKWSKPGNRSQPQVDELPPVIASNEQPPANANPLGTQVVTTQKPTRTKVENTPRETVKHTETRRTESPQPTTVKPKPKPKPTVVKAKPKPKPKSTRYVVKKGDSLSTIATRNGSSVSAIQRANGISGTLIRPGQSLVIPKR